MKDLEMWGGTEYSLKPIDQSSFHSSEMRLHSLKRVKDIGFKKLRFPCLWEKIASRELDRCDWSELDEQLYELKNLDQDIIAGFLHHGSGPVYTSLIDPDFPEKFSTYARAFAKRYPWVVDYTPISGINEAARSCCLDGNWYPHLKNDLYYLKALLYQCKATVLAMKEIRVVNPKARLILAEELGSYQGTPEAGEIWDFENNRRWLCLDLLYGKVDLHHPLYGYMIQHGIRSEEILWFEENTCPPDVIGINHRLDSHRFIDHRFELYPENTHRRNSLGHYAEISSLETGEAEQISFEETFREVWDRYHLPIAVTEAYVSGHRENQMRWLNQIWKAAQNVKRHGVDVRAVTAWNIFGSEENHQYSPGVFDLRKNAQETALGQLVREFALNENGTHPTLISEGVWETPRIKRWSLQKGDFTRLYHRSDARPVLVVGASGTLGQGLARVCGARNIAYKLVQKREMDLMDKDAIEQMIDLHRPWAIINAAGYSKVREWYDEEKISLEDHFQGALNLARACHDHNVRLITFSSISNEKNEKYLMDHCPQSLIIRTDSYFGPWDNKNIVTRSLESLIQRNEVYLSSDPQVSPTYVPDLVNESLNLLIDEENGIVHLAHGGNISREELVRMAAMSAQDILGVDPNLVKGKPSYSERREHSFHNHETIIHLPPLEDAMIRFVAELQVSFPHRQEIQ